MTNSYYDLTLAPLTKYFFGGERFFDKDDGVFYFERSRLFPQQSSVLGLLRYQMLLAAGLLEQQGRSGVRVKHTATDEASKLIGANSFGGAYGPDTFGQLAAISPLNIVDEAGRYWYVYPKAIQEDGSLSEIVPGTRSGHFAGIVNDGATTDKIPRLLNYNAKKGLTFGFWQPDTKAYLKQEDVFEMDIVAEEQVGIHKANRQAAGIVQQTANDGFYKYQFAALKPGFKFGFSAQMSTTTSIQNNVVRFGKEGSPFRLSIKKGKTFAPPSGISANDTVLLTSDAYLPDHWQQYCQSVVCRSLSFRSLKFKTSKDTNYADKPAQSERYNLVQRGSLLYVKDDAQQAQLLSDLFSQQTAFRSVGYNYFMLI